MRLMTWNVLWRFEPDWRARERAILATLDTVRPDVLGLQECWAVDTGTQADVVADFLGAHAAFAGSPLPPVPDPPEQTGQAGIRMGVGLVSRWPIRVIAEHVLPVSHRQVAPVALEAEIERPEGPFRVLVAATEWEPEYADDHVAQTTRLAELLEQAEAEQPAFLLADLNCDPTQPPFAPLATALDTWQAAGGDPGAVTLSSAVPFAPLEATAELDRRIDHVLAPAGSGATVDGASIVDQPIDGLYPSDHFPVVVDVRLLGEHAPA
ncbi:MAG TPA: endonuclease/exonuclease/phosphatase family protein [Naasia sp.]|jgi:endonuclease/exonuclease/phosphatase family metal-dependent hydrolase